MAAIVRYLLASALIFHAVRSELQNCKSGYTWIEGYGCYLYSTDQTTWHDAIQYCSDRVGVLAEFQDMAHNSAILMDTSGDHAVVGTDYWIALSDVDAEGLYVWETFKDPVTFTSWGAGEPNGGTAQNCIAASGSHSHFWADEDCSLMKNPICYGGNPVYNCPDGWVYSEAVNRCYYYGDYPLDKFKWDGANLRCKEMHANATMVEIETNEEQLALNSILSGAQMGIWYWLGLTDRQEEGVYRWEGGSNNVANFTWFYINHSPSDSYDCVYMDKDELFHWKENSCDDDGWQILCEMPPLIEFEK